MAKTLSNTNTDFVLKLLNTDEQKKLFFELKDNIQIKTLNSAFRKAGKIILDTAKSNFDSTKKNKSLTSYSDLAKSFKMKAMKSEIGMIIGMEHRQGYKYRFLNYGTKERFYKTKGGKAGFYKNAKSQHSTGVIKPSNFFTNAVSSKSNEAQESLSNEIILSLERVVKKYEKNK